MAMPDTYAYLLIMVALPSGEYSINKVWYKTSSTIVVGEGDLAAASLSSLAVSNFAAKYHDCLSIKATFTGIEAYVVTPVGTFAHLRIVNAVGDVSGDMCPNYTAVLINKRVARPGRKSLGRCFIPGVPESFTLENYITDVALALYQELADMFMNEIVATAATWEPCLYSPTDDQLTDLSAVGVVERLASIRSRKPR
jgi:hypothetical protein